MGTDFEAAKSILAELKARAQKADYGLLDNDFPIAELREAYLKRCRQALRASSVERYENALDNILDWLGVQKVRQLDVSRVLEYREQRVKEACPGTVNYEVERLAGMLRWGVKPGRLIGSNPLEDIERLLYDHKKEGRPLADDEVARLLKTSPPHWRDVWYAFLVTGLREDELASLLFTDIDWQAREIIVRKEHAKGKEGRRIPVEDSLLAILKRLAAEAPNRQPCSWRGSGIAEGVRRRLTTAHVFVTRENTPLTNRGGLYRTFLRHCEKAGIEVRTYDNLERLAEHVDVHSLRRTFATNAIVNGADPKSVQEILGHKTLALTMKIYAKVKAAPKRQAVARLSYGGGATSPEHLLPVPATPA